MTDPIMDGEAVVACQGLCKRVRMADEELRILDDIDLRIGVNTTVSISGSSGSGKTTLLGLLAGMDTPSHGEVRLFGQSLGTLDEDRRAALRRGRVGFVFQSFHLLPNLTAQENVSMALEIAGADGDIAARAAEALDRVGLSRRRRHLPSQLSGGECQRVALARAMVVQPDLLFADEPTGNLDHATRDEIVSLLFDLRAEHGCTLVLVTHDEALAARCDDQHRLDAGRLVA